MMLRLFVIMFSGIMVAISMQLSYGDSETPTEFVPVDTSHLTNPPFPFVLENAFPGLSFPGEVPVQVLDAGDDSDRLFVACHSGRIHVFADRPDVRSSKVFLDLSHKKSGRHREEGVFGLVFHPDYQHNGELFVSYWVVPPQGITSVWLDVSAIFVLLLATFFGGRFSGARQFVIALHLVLSFICSLIALVVIEHIVGQAHMMDRRYVILACLLIGLVALLPFTQRIHQRIRHIGILRHRSFAAACGFVSGSTLVLIGAMFALFFLESLQPAVLDSHTGFYSRRLLRRVLPVTEEFINAWSHHSPLVVSRFLVSNDPDRADAATEEVVISIPQEAVSHRGGSMEFGPDGCLYIGTGDGGGAYDYYGNGQNLSTLQGSILRIDVDRRSRNRAYAIPSDNPFAGRSEKIREEIWAFGFRNTWRIAFDQKTGELWTGDVGQYSFEEANIVLKGGNYGWGVREGRQPVSPENTSDSPLLQARRQVHTFASSGKLIDPVICYPHSEGKGITGGRVYHGSDLPELDGAYIYADCVSGNVWAAYHDKGKLIRNLIICSQKTPIIGFGEGRTGQVYLCGLDGLVYRLSRATGFRESDAAPVPQRLSETGLFESIEDLKPVAGMIPYSVQVPLWSDHAVKERYMALPASGGIEFSANGQWKLPVGTVLVKTFSLEMKQDDPESRRRLETRLLIHSSNGWDGYTYVWNDEQNEATLIRETQEAEFDVATTDGVRRQVWHFPSRSECNMCHTKAAGHVLGLNTRQLNRVHEYSDRAENQLERFNRMGLFKTPLAEKPETMESFPDWEAQDGSGTEYARAWMDVNCANCHTPGGVITAIIDVRYHTPLSQSGLLSSLPSRSPGVLPVPRLIEPGDVQRSELLQHILSQDYRKMPPVGTNIPDETALRHLRAWINEIR